MVICGGYLFVIIKYGGILIGIVTYQLYLTLRKLTFARQLIMTSHRNWDVALKIPDLCGVHRMYTLIRYARTTVRV